MMGHYGALLSKAVYVVGLFAEKTFGNKEVGSRHFDGQSPFEHVVKNPCMRSQMA